MEHQTRGSMRIDVELWRLKMDVVKSRDGDSLNMVLTGRLDTSTAPQLEEDLATSLDGVASLTIDFTDLEYISSAGLRVLLSTQKTMSKQGDMTLLHVSEPVMEVFDMTGFSSILNIK